MRSAGVMIRWGLVVAAFGWVLALVFAAWVASRGQPDAVAWLFSAAVYAMGALVCHQRPERSFHWWAVQAPVCARCIGLYGSAAAGALVAAALRLGEATRDWDRRLDRLSVRARVWLAAAAAPLAATILYEWGSGVMPSHWIRAASAVPIGLALSIVIAEGVAAVGARAR